MREFKYPEDADAMNEYIKSLPATICTFDNAKGTVLVEIDESVTNIVGEQQQ